MIQEIKFNGFTAQPSDYECPDGDLSTAINIVPENGSLEPVLSPTVVLHLDQTNDASRVVYIHKTASYKHYIMYLRDAGELYWFEDMDINSDKSVSGEHVLVEIAPDSLYSVTSIGNTLIVLTTEGMHYFFWQSEGNTSNYLHLGTDMPECPISFGLQGYTRLYTKQENDEEGRFIVDIDRSETFTDEIKEKLTSEVLAKVNKFMADIQDSEDDNAKFCYPFFVRYAYRLYDGSLTRHSAPILMIPSTKGNPLVIYDPTVQERLECDIFTVACKLDYIPLTTSAELSNLRNWGDIIKSVDIFVSAPIYTYDQSGECDRLANVRLEAGFGVLKYSGGDYEEYANETVYGITSYYQKWKHTDLLCRIFAGQNYGYCVRLPYFTDSEIAEKVKENSLFYLLKSIPIEELSVSSRKVIDVEKGHLSSIVTRERMTDDYQSHDLLIPKTAYAYNSRLNIANLKRRLFGGFDTDSMVCYNNGFIEYNFSGGNETGTLHNSVLKPVMITSINSDGEVIGVQNECTNNLYEDVGYYLYYPDPGAKSMTYNAGYGIGAKSVKLEEHNGLNGSFFFSGFSSVKEASITSTGALLSGEPTISIPNKIYTSEVNNPFYFPLLGINTIGTGEIIGLSSATKALSEGQFGQFPLYAFTTEGVWALEINSNGGFSAKQPATRDVCVHAPSITQIDDSVLFAADRGIMQLIGSNSVCISEQLNNRKTIDITAELPLAVNYLINALLTVENVVVYPFQTYVRSCEMIYDYTNQRIILFNKSYKYAYVYSLREKRWGMMSSNIGYRVNSYPEALATDTNGNLIDFSRSDATNAKGIIITRPFKLDAPDSLKTISTLYVRGKFKVRHVRCILYGSRNLFDWHPVSSSMVHMMRNFSGTPYKYFRLMVIGALDKGESIDGFTVQYTNRFTNRIR